MKITLDWLREHIDTDLGAEEIGARLTMAGLELDGLQRLDAGLEKVVVGFLEEVKPHPDAERLTLCRVRIGQERLAVVCGARNHQAGDKVAVARVGAELPNGMKILESKIRGVTSQGMLCSLKELGLASESDGILLLPAHVTEGEGIARVLGRDAVVLELGITPNRGDCLGVRGVARELGAVTGRSLRPLPAIRHVAASGPAPAIRIEDGAGCPRYAGRIVRNVRVGPSPEWLRARLEAVGLRAINNVVDVTNFILMDLNHPMHAFDLATIELPILVRKAREGEMLRTLDGLEKKLSASMTVIADAAKPLALAGIMGGEASGVTEATTDILLEAAFFDPITTARTGRRLELLSDSRHRFERGVDPEGLITAMEQATRLILDLAGGEAGPIELVDAGTWQAQNLVRFRPERINRLGGVALESGVMREMLVRLGCVVEPDGDAFLALPPSWRHDLRVEEDILEEIIRLHGYDKVPTTLPRVPAEPPTPDPMHALMGRIRAQLVGQGYLEAINYVFVAPVMQGRFNKTHVPLALQNPLSVEQSVLRTDLCVGLVEAAQRNLNRGNHRLRLFELGRVFLPDAAGAVVERERLAGLLTGPAEEPNPHVTARQVDFFDLKGDLEGFFYQLTGMVPTLQAGEVDFLHPRRQAVLRLADGSEAGWMGQLHPALQEELDLRREVYLFEMDLEPLAGVKKRRASEGSESRFPSIQSDLTFLLPMRVQAGDLLEEATRTDERWIRRATIASVYIGEGMPEGMKSVSLSLLIQADDRTLTDAESRGVSERVVARMRDRFGANLR
ncbi:MAG: phenylalanine--tRNA ligase subunit beta [Magnetococcales bacterium]|nr:phenylalanine--tRNA ligase subunit beta [Magnetococcales bacterium]